MINNASENWLKWGIKTSIETKLFAMRMSSCVIQRN